MLNDILIRFCKPNPSSPSLFNIPYFTLFSSFENKLVAWIKYQSKDNFSFWCFSRRVSGKTIISHSKCQSWWFEWGRGANMFNIHIRMKIPSPTFHIIPHSSPNRRYHLQKHHPRHFKYVQGNALICLCLNRQCLDTFVPYWYAYYNYISAVYLKGESV